MHHWPVSASLKNDLGARNWNDLRTERSFIRLHSSLSDYDLTEKGFAIFISEKEADS